MQYYIQLFIGHRRFLFIGLINLNTPMEQKRVSTNYTCIRNSNTFFFLWHNRKWSQQLEVPSFFLHVFPDVQSNQSIAFYEKEKSQISGLFSAKYVLFKKLQHNV